MQQQQPARQIPPRLPRALFIAAWASAARVELDRDPQPRPSQAPSYLDKRDAALRNVARGVGLPIIAAGAAANAFLKHGTMMAKPEPPAPKLDPIAAVLIADHALALAIGRPDTVRCEDAPWLEIRRDAVMPHLKIYWRGEFMQGDRMVKLLKEDGDRISISEADGETVGSARTCDLDRFGEGVDAAIKALRRAEINLSSFREIRRLNTPTLDGGPAFKGAVATIGLAKAPPVWAKQLRQQPGFAR